jgi:hypothetical protein
MSVLQAYSAAKLGNSVDHETQYILSKKNETQYVRYDEITGMNEENTSCIAS